MKKVFSYSSAVCLVLLPLLSGCSQSKQMTAWDRHCASCHDGRTVLNGTVVIGKDAMREKFKSLEQFVSACGASAPCMNILKHREELLREVGKELGLGAAPGK